MAKRGDEDDDKRPTSKDGDPEGDAPEQEDEGEEDESASAEGDDAKDESDEDDDAKDESDEDDEAKDESDEDDEAKDESDEDDEAKDESDEDDEAKDESDEDDDANDESDEDDDAKDESEPLAASSDEEGEQEEVMVAGQLGVQRYVYSAFFASVMLGGFILGRALETLWERVAVSDWAVRNIPAVTGVPDESKATYSFIAAGVVAVIVGVYNFRKAHVRRWAEDVSTELLKVKWPTRKEVYASTVVVLATSAVAVVYLFLLDRFWGFLTDKIYGMGS